MIDDRAQAEHNARIGVAYGIAAYGAWGFAPVYFKAVADVPAMEVLGHRVIWSVLLLIILLVVRHRINEAMAALRDRRTLLTLCGTTLLIAVNWYLFIWAVAHEFVLQASLGYFVNPLVNVLLGYVFLRERLGRIQKISVGLASVGVGYMAIAVGTIPWISLVLACSFGLYGLLRKTARVGPLVGLATETVILLPAAIAYLAWLAIKGSGKFGTVSLSEDALLAFAGVMTAVPLIWFANAAKRLRLSTLGFLQYLAPTGHFLLAVLAYGEPFTRVHVVTFAFIWTALAIYTVDATRFRKRYGQ